MDKVRFSCAVVDCEQTLYRISKSILDCDSYCEDAVQETILKAYKNISALKNEEYFKTWLVRILINECKHINKTENRTYEIKEYMLTEYYTDSHEKSEVYQAIMKLPVKVRITVVLYYIEGYSIVEIKNILKIPEGTVKSRLSTGRNQLKKYLEE